MEYRPLGRTGLQVSAIGFGCQEIGGGYGDIEEPEFARAVGRALDLGINCFDTAEAYGFGASERGARARARAAAATRRSISTKFGTGYPDRPNFRDGTPQRVLASIDQSLQQPRHRPRRRVHRPLARPRHAVRGDDGRARRARAGGQGPLRRRLELHRVDELAACMRTRRVDVVQYGLSMFDRRMEREILPYCAEQGIGVRGLRRARVRAARPARSPPDRRFPADDWRSKTDKWGVMAPLFDRTSSAPAGSRATSPRREELQRARGPLRPEPPAARAPVGDVATRA